MKQNNKTYLTKIFYFCAAHQYGHDEWTKEKNYDVFGEDMFVHGHNYTLYVTVTGEIDPSTGFLVDLGYLKRVVNEEVIQKLDHRQIEKDVDWFKDKQPSSENLVEFIWNVIENRLKGCILYRIRLQETPTIYTDYYGGIQ